MSPSVSVYAVESSDELRMNAKYSPISHRIAVTPPKPTTRPKSSQPADVGSRQRRRERAAQERPVDEMVCVVPPVDGVVEIERVADRVDEKRQDEKNVGCIGISGPPTTSSPDRRHDERCDRVADESPPERLTGKPLKPGKAPKASRRTSESLTARLSQKADRIEPPIFSAALDMRECGRALRGNGRSWIRTTDLRLIRAAL